MLLHCGQHFYIAKYTKMRFWEKIIVKKPMTVWQLKSILNTYPEDMTVLRPDVEGRQADMWWIEQAITVRAKPEEENSFGFRESIDWEKCLLLQ